MKIINFLKNKTLNANSILRILSSWLIYGIIYEIFGLQLIAMPFYIILLIFILIFLILSLISITIKKNNFDYYLLIILSLILSNVWVYKSENIHYILILFLLNYLIYKYKLKDINFKKTNKKISPKIIILFGLISFIIISTIGITRYLSFTAPNFDLGIPSQMFYYMKKTGLPLTTCERNVLLSHFAIHFSPIYYLVLPLYFLFSSPITLQICSGLLVAIGIIPTYLLCKSHKLPNIVTVIICFIYSIYAPAICSSYYDFHEIMFLLPLFLWLFYYYEKNNNILFTIFAILILLTKEDAAIYLMVFSVYMIFDNNKKKGFITLISSIIYFVTVVSLINKYGEAVMTDRYYNLILTNTNSEMIEVFKTIITNPGYFIKQLITSSNNSSNEKIYYYLKIFLPFGFCIFNTKKFKNYILLIPIIYVTMTTYIYSYDINFQYSYPIYAFLFYLFIISIDENKNYNYLFMCIVGSTLVFSTYSLTKFVNEISNYDKFKDIYNEKRKFLDTIPDTASVTANSFLIPYLSKRDELYEINYHNFQNLTDYIVTDIDLNEYLNEEDINKYIIIDTYQEIHIYKKQ